MTEKNNTIPIEEIEKQNQYMALIRMENDRFEIEKGYRRKAFVLTLGCQQNEADSEKLSGMAQEMGYDIVYEPDEASLIIVNTCAIREHAEQRALSLVGQYKHIKAKNPDLKIVICGCMVVQEHRIQDIKMKYPYVDILFGTSSLHRFPSLLYEKMEKGKRIFCRDEKEYCVAEGLPIRRENKFKAWVSVMYGCNNFCSYCIVPYVRGRERSRKMEEVVKEVRQLVESGYKDITLLGQNVNSYGKDLGLSYDFADLLSEIDKIDGDHLIHFMTSHPKDASRKLIDVMSASKHVARHFHLPMQAGSDRVLKVMNRRYDFEKYMGIVEYIREKMPDCVITSDIIVGFPSETDDEFEMTLDALKKVRFDMIYSFIYSQRKGTPAAEMEEQISAEEKRRRMDRLLTVQNEISLERNKAMVGKTVSVLCEGLSKNNDSVYSGRTEGGKIVFFDGDETDTGRFLNIKIERADTFALYGIKN
jgi:tRNA-2-methylthio-N6-dimethylallyladenosine synthase